jgi:hypothetical protein
LISSAGISSSAVWYLDKKRNLQNAFYSALNHWD